MNIENNNETEKDIILIQKIVHNKEIDLFKNLIEKYKSLVFNLSLKMIGNYNDANDITQEVFIKVYTKLKDYKIKYNFKDWLYSICLNTIKDRLRKRKFSFLSLDRHIQTDNGDFFFDIPDTDEYGNPEKNLFKKEQSKYLYKAILSLSTKYKTVIILKYIENLPLEKISEITKLSLPALKTRLFRAQKILYKKLKNKPWRI